MAGSLSQTLPWEMASSKWAASLDPVLANPIVNGQLLKNITLVSGKNTISHRLQRKLQGYFVVLNSASTTFYDAQSTNQMPDLTLILYASGATTVSLYVF